MCLIGENDMNNLNLDDTDVINKKYFIGYSTSENIRYKSSSGGIGTAIIKYLLETETFGTAMTFEFDREGCQYVPKLIYRFPDYNNCGSIYQDTDTIGFIKQNVDKIRSGIIVTCMPCQVKAIRSFLRKNQIKYFIISLCCSGQTTKQGSWYYYKLLGIEKEDVENVQYRGNGWPSGIQIWLRDGRVIKKDNYTYPWTLMHNSLLFRPKRCLCCKKKTSEYADVSLADPWLKEYIDKDRIGNSIAICNDLGENVLKRMHKEGKLVLGEVDEETYIRSQLGTIEAKADANNFKLYNKIVGKMGEESCFYKKIITSSVLTMKLHIKIIDLLRKVVKSKL